MLSVVLPTRKKRHLLVTLAAGPALSSYAWGLKMPDNFSGKEIGEKRSFATCLLAKLGNPVHECALFDYLGEYLYTGFKRGLGKNLGITTDLLVCCLTRPANPAVEISSVWLTSKF